MSKVGRQKTITIRGVDEEAYRSLSELAKSMNVSVGYLASQAFKLFVSLVGTGSSILLVPAELTRRLVRVVPKSVRKVVPRVVRHVERLTINAADLKELKSPVIFIGVRELVFEDDVTEELFERKVLRIVDCGVVEVPRHIRKFTVLEKATFIKEVRVRS